MDDEPVADHLQDLHEHEQQNDGDDHDVGLEALVTETDRKVAKATAADDARHRGIRDQRDRSDRGAGEDAWPRFGQQRTEDDLPRVGTHGLGRFDDAAVDFAQRGFDEPREEGRGTDDERGIAPATPSDVPVMNTVKGIITMSRITKGTERSTLTTKDSTA